MTLCYLIASGNWDNPSIWNNAAIPVAGDDVYTNGFNVTINVPSVTVKSLQNAALASPVVLARAGVYTISVACTLTVTGGILHAHHDGISAGPLITTTTGAHAITITAPVIESGHSTNVFLYAFQPIAGYTGAITLNASGGIYGGERGFAIRTLGSGAIVINANLYGVADVGIGNGIGVRVDAAAPSVTINGNLYGAPPGNSGGGSGGGFATSGAGVIPITINGSLYGTNNGYAAQITNPGALVINAVDIFASGAQTALIISGAATATVRATTIKNNGRGAAISNSGGTTRILRVSGNVIASGVETIAVPYPGAFPIVGRFNIIQGEPFSLKIVDDSAYPGGAPLPVYRAGGGAGTVIAVPGNAPEIVDRAIGALFTITQDDVNTVTLGMPGAFDNLSDPDLFAAQLNNVFGSETDFDTGWITVTARGVQMLADTSDVGGDPNHRPAAGTVTFTPNLTKPIKRLSTSEILVVSSVVAVFDAGGELSFDGVEDVRLIAPLWSDLSNTTWKWTATFQPGSGQTWTAFAVSFTGAPGAIVNLGSLVG